MPRPTGIIKRQPEIDAGVKRWYAKTSKADLVEALFSFIRMIHGEALTDEEIMQIAEKEIATIKLNRANHPFYDDFPEPSSEEITLDYYKEFYSNFEG